MSLYHSLTKISVVKIWPHLPPYKNGGKEEIYVKNLSFPCLLFLNYHFLRARLRRILWVKFHLIKSVVLAKMSQKLQIIIDVQTDVWTDRWTIFYTKAVTVLLLNFTCIIFLFKSKFARSYSCSIIF